MKGHEDAEEPGASLLGGRAGGAGTVGAEKAQDGYEALQGECEAARPLPSGAQCQDQRLWAPGEPQKVPSGHQETLCHCVGD